MDKALRYIGLARAGGMLAVGEESSGAAVRSGKAKLLLLACDASDNAVRRARGFISGGKTPLLQTEFTKLELAEAAGDNVCAMAAVTDIGLAGAIAEALAESSAEKYGEVARLLGQRRDKAAQRRAEAAAHERNKRVGKRRKDK